MDYDVISLTSSNQTICDIENNINEALINNYEPTTAIETSSNTNDSSNDYIKKLEYNKNKKHFELFVHVCSVFSAWFMISAISFGVLYYFLY